MQSLLCFCTLRPQLLLLLLLLLQLPPLSFAAAPVAETITVDHRGGGDFRTVQAAVDSVPDGNREWIRIHVKKGNYREKVTVPTHKHYILLEGDGCWKTAISYGAHAHAGIGHIMRRRRRRNVADYGIVRNIDFKNMYNIGRLSRWWRRSSAATRSPSTAARSTASRTRSATSPAATTSAAAPSPAASTSSSLRPVHLRRLRSHLHLAAGAAAAGLGDRARTRRRLRRLRASIQGRLRRRHRPSVPRPHVESVRHRRVLPHRHRRRRRAAGVAGMARRT